MLSLPDALARTLGEHIGAASKRARARRRRARRAAQIGDLCKECGQATLIYEEGCKKCVSCGYQRVLSVEWAPMFSGGDYDEVGRGGSGTS